MDDIAVHRHLAQICGKICNPQLRHTLFYESRLLLGNDKFYPYRVLVTLARHRSGPFLWRVVLWETADGCSSFNWPRTVAFCKPSIYSFILPGFAW